MLYKDGKAVMDTSGYELKTSLAKMENRLKYRLSLSLVVLLFSLSFRCYPASKIYIISDPDRSSIYVDGVFRGTFSSYHEQALEIVIKPGKHFIEAIKVDEGNALLYQQKEVTIEPEDWRVVHLKLLSHPESGRIGKTDKNVEDFIAKIPPREYPQRRLISMFGQKTTKEKENKAARGVGSEITTVTIGDFHTHDLPEIYESDLKNFALNYKSYKERRAITGKRSDNRYTLTTPPPYMVEIPGGTFCDYSGGECKKVELKPFWIGRKEVTVKEWRECMNAGICPNLPSVNSAISPQQAINGISYVDAKKFLSWMSDSAGISARLPTDTEWKYAAYANKATRFPWGDAPQPGKAKCYENRTRTTNVTQSSLPGKVGAYNPNGFGLYDVVGNVAELTSSRSIRGGSWVTDCELADIDHVERPPTIETRNIGTGLRLAMDKIMPKSSDQNQQFYCIDNYRGIGEITYYQYSNFKRCFPTRLLDGYIEKYGL
jgi:formylglycine-generating enzyme required for sulfatase activity